jgi:hypothetical protein
LSEREPGTELHFARRRGLRDLAKCRGAYTIRNGRVTARSGDNQAAHVATILVMVEGIEGIHLEQELDALGNAELLAYGGVKVIDARLG